MSTHNAEQLANPIRRYSAFGTMLLIVGGFFFIIVGNTPVQAAGGAMLLLALITPSLGKMLLPAATEITHEPGRGTKTRTDTETKNSLDWIGRDQPRQDSIPGNLKVQLGESDLEPREVEIVNLAGMLFHVSLREERLSRGKFEARIQQQLERRLLRQHAIQGEGYVPTEVLEAEVHLGVDYALHLYDSLARQQGSQQQHRHPRAG